MARGLLEGDTAPLCPHRVFAMSKRPLFVRPLIAAAALGLSLAALAHGDVTPHPIDTTGLKALGADWQATNPYRGNAKAVAVGAEGYEHNCAGCHGLNAVSGGVAPDLLKLDTECLHAPNPAKRDSCMADTDDYFKDITLHGKKNSEGRYTMPAYESVFTQEAVWALRTYIDQRTLEAGDGK
jgi:cytochrome c-550 PedF